MSRRLPPGYPQFFRSASGCRLQDLAGTEYVDLMCGYGPIVLGYGDPDVEAAAAAQRGRGDLMTGPAECQVELAELVVETIPHADWVLFAKNGTDAMTACVTIARAGTQRRKVLVAKGSYHGAAPWCTPSLAGVTAEDRAHILHFEYNDVASLERVADEAGRDLAAVLVTAFKHDVRRHQEAPTPAFAQAVRRICDAAGAALILDDVRAGFRLHIGGSWEPYGVRPDLCAWSKAIANGHPLAAVTGTDRFRDAAQQVYVTGSFWCSAVPMAAAIATIKKLRATGAIATMEAMGHRLRDGLEAAGTCARCAIAADRTGPDADDHVRGRSGFRARLSFRAGSDAAWRLHASLAQHVSVCGTPGRRHRSCPRGDQRGPQAGRRFDRPTPICKSDAVNAVAAFIRVKD